MMYFNFKKRWGGGGGGRGGGGGEGGEGGEGGGEADLSPSIRTRFRLLV